MCLSAQPLGLAPHTNQARGASLSPTPPHTLPTGLLAPPSTPSRYSLAKEEREASPCPASCRTHAVGAISHTRTPPLWKATTMMTNPLPSPSTSPVPGTPSWASLCYIIILDLLTENGGSERERGLSEVTEHYKWLSQDSDSHLSDSGAHALNHHTRLSWLLC